MKNSDMNTIKAFMESDGDWCYPRWVVWSAATVQLVIFAACIGFIGWVLVNHFRNC